MGKLILKFTVLAMLTLCLLCQKTQALELSPQPDQMGCLTRDQKERIVICFEENAACHLALEKSAKAPEPDWEITALSTLAGVLGGILIGAQINH